MSIRVALADDHHMVSEALVVLLNREQGIEVVGTAGDGPSALALARETVPDVMVLDIAMPKLNGIDVTRTLLCELPATKILILSAYTDKRFMQEALRAGAVGYVAKAAASSELSRAIRTIADGQNFLSPEITTAMIGEFASNRGEPGGPVSMLTPREREVLRLVAEGVRSASIGRRLGISESTVEVHRRNVMHKLELRSVAELTKYAVREGISSL